MIPSHLGLCLYCLLILVFGAPATQRSGSSRRDDAWNFKDPQRGFSPVEDGRNIKNEEREIENLLLRALEEFVIEDESEEVNKEVKKWLEDYNEDYRKLCHSYSLASWAYRTNLTSYNAEQLSKEDKKLNDWMITKLPQAKVFVGKKDLINDPHHVRMLKFITTHNEIPPSDRDDIVKTLSETATQLEEMYGNAKVVKDGKSYSFDPDLAKILAKSRDPDELLWAWRSWRDVTGKQMRTLYTRLTENMNIAARDAGYNDAGESWKIANFDTVGIESMADDSFEVILPMYKQLHAYVRRKLREKYGDEHVGQTGYIPAHLLGNMWAQEWNNVFDLVKPYPNADDYDVTAALRQKGYTPKKMFQLAESFFTSLGLEPMTQDFWAKSMITRPENVSVVCHPSAEDFFSQTDFRIKMCTEVNRNNLKTIHHEMGHVQYFMQYRNQPALFRTGANSGLHESVGDTMALSVSTPEHLQAVGLIDDDDDDSDDDDNDDISEKEINFLMEIALEKLSFLPFGYLVDKWRWRVFEGTIQPHDYNKKWWEYRENFQGVKAPVARSEDDFDPGAKYHVAGNVPYIRYFFSHLMQFSFHKALCKAKGHTGPLHRCDIYNSLEAGKKLKSVLRLGASEPWPKVMQLFTGSRDMSSNAMKEYLQPLLTWLEKDNQEHGETIGWN